MHVTRSCRQGEELTAHGGAEGGATDASGWQERPRSRANGRRILLSALVLLLSYGGMEPAYARECSTSEAKRIAVDYYGGQVVSVTREGDYMLVRLELSDGRHIDVAIDRWGC